MKLCGGEIQPDTILQRRINKGKMIVKKGLWMEVKDRFVYHVLPSILILLFVIINDVYDMFDSYI